MAHAIRLPLKFDTPHLRQELARIEHAAWMKHFNTAYYQGKWEVVSLRSTSGKTSEIYPDVTKTEYTDTPLLQASAVFQNALAQFQCPLRCVRLMRLAAGAEIREHRDLALSFDDGEIRVHIPIQTNPQLEFYLAGERVVMAEGEAWFLDLTEKHSVINKGTEDRIHLVVDCVVNDWLRQLAGKT